MVEIATAGTTIRIEFMKYGFSPVASTPIWAVDQADAQGASVGSTGSDLMLPPVISDRGFRLLIAMMNSGSR